MVSPLALRIKHEPLRSRAAATITAAYLPIGTAIENQARNMLIQNLTDKILFFSLNGVDDGFPLLQNTSFVLDITANKTFDTGFFLSVGEKLYVKYDAVIGAPTAGTYVYLTVFYGD